MNENTQYTEASRAGLQRIYGTGFTSPGGPAEMADLLAGLDVSGMEVMDLGCGLGGDSLLLGGEFGAASVKSVDIDAGNLEVTSRAVEAAGLSAVISPTLVTPGPLPFADGCFDLVHSKAMICHVDDKVALFRDVRRVLRPDGMFAAADWFVGPDGERSESYREFTGDLAAAGLIFFFETADAYRAALDAAGFDSIQFRNNSPSVRSFAEKQLQDVAGSARDDLVKMLGEEGYAGMLRRSHARVAALTSGDLQFQYILAVRRS